MQEEEGTGDDVVEVGDVDITLEEKAENEWAEVEKLQNERASATSTATPVSLVPLTYDEVVAHFMSLDLTEQKKNIVTEDTRTKGLFSSFFSLFFTSASLSSKLIQERDSIFAIALIAYNNSDVMHHKLLQNIYFSIQGVTTEVSRLGSHWEEIGFQGDDPATDLRGVGMFGLIQLFHLVKSHSELAKKLHKISRDEHQYFPFSVVSLNFTKVVLQTMRSGVLTSKFNKRGCILPVLNELHIGLYYELYVHWKRGHRTISDFPPLLKELTEKCTKAPDKVEANYKAYQKSLADGSDEKDHTIV
eukprot:Phypoly_transcript_04083.p2 GENE.Phypoly_transcript_04083~~Phypoly_transcript_04083.p2  ORF type:complete len:303 (+),score=44.57 Phypoly_transcript_04083:189-1097(+)